MLNALQTADEEGKVSDKTIIEELKNMLTDSDPFIDLFRAIEGRVINQILTCKELVSKYRELFEADKKLSKIENELFRLE